jgi:pimeloyl-ACP methyl ester carboxylesterase
MNNALATTSSVPAWVDHAQYPFAVKRFETADGALSYVDEGAGPTVLFVHGTPSWSFEWRAVIAALRADHRCVAVDHLGFGLSDKPRDAPLAPEDHARRLRALVEALDLREVTLVVHDFGGPIGIPLALDCPERVARVVAINTWMWPNGEDPEVRKLDRVIRSPIGRFLYRWLNFSPRVLLPSTFAVKKRLTRALHAQYLRPFARRADREAPYQLARALLGADPHYAALWARRDELARKPLTVLWGMKDPALSERHLKRWVDSFARATVVRVEDAGHFVAEERPDAVIDAVRA